MIDERARHDLLRAAEAALGPAPATTLMALLPSLDELRRLDARIEVEAARARGRVEADLARVDTRLDGVEGRLALVDDRCTRVARDLADHRLARVRAEAVAVLVAGFGVVLWLAAGLGA